MNFINMPAEHWEQEQGFLEFLIK